MTLSLDTDTLLGLQQAILEKLVRRVDRQLILEDLCRVVEAAAPGSVCSIMLLDERAERLRIVAAPSVPSALVAELDGLVPGELSGSCGCAVHFGEIVIVDDTLADPRWESLRDAARRFRIKSCWSVPIACGDGRACGSFAISHTTHRSPDDMQRRLLETGGFLAGLAIERDRVDAELSQKSLLLDSILHSIEDAVFAKDLEGRYLVVNHTTAETARTTIEGMVGRFDEEFFPRELADSFRETDSIVLGSGESHHYEQCIRPGEADERRFLVCKTPLRDSRGEIVGIVGIARDVTALRRAERALQQRQKLESLGVLAGGIAHDFNNLLAGMLGHAELARAHAQGSPIDQNLEQIEIGATRAAELVTQMLAYAGRAEVQKSTLDLAALIRGARSLLETSISRKTSLELHLDADLPPLEADATQLRQVVMNLVTNASEALGEEPGRVEVRLQRDSNWLRLTVTDSGYGMDPETCARIFAPFFTTKFTGRGLGLAAVQGIVRSHGGRIDVESQLGLGTRVDVRLPYRAGATPEADESSVPHGEPRKRRVLVVDDEPTVRELFGLVLEAGGYEVVSAIDGLDAVERLQGDHGRVDLLLLDLTTPRLCGRAAFDAIRALRPGLPTLLTSGFDEGESRREFEEGDLVGFVKKPFRPSQLIETVDRIFE